MEGGPKRGLKRNWEGREGAEGDGDCHVVGDATELKKS